VSQARIQGHIATLAASTRFTPQQRTDAADYITGQLEGWGYTVTESPFPGGINLVARAEGTTRPDEVFILSGHYDTVSGSPGADDDASGVAGVLEVARVLAGVPLEASVEFVFFDLEEAGLVGSTAYAQAAAGNGTDVIGMLSLEMIAFTCATPGCQFAFVGVPGCIIVAPGGVDVGNFIGVVSNNASSPLQQTFALAVALFVPSLQQVSAVVAGTGTCFPDTRRSDHGPFWDQGYPALMITDTANFRNPNYHASTDTLPTLDLAFARDVTQATLATVVMTAVLGPLPVPVPAFPIRGTTLVALVVAGALLLRRHFATGAESLPRPR
jgi:hypothetical protein